jgi:hypothetical protein
MCQSCQPYAPAAFRSQEIFLVLISVRLSRNQGHSAAGRAMSMTNSNDTIRTRNCDLPEGSVAPQLKAPPRAPVCI